MHQTKQILPLAFILCFLFLPFSGNISLYGQNSSPLDPCDQLMADGIFSKAIECYLGHVHEPDLAAASWFGACKASYHQKDYKMSSKYLKKALKKEKADADHWFFSGALYLQQGKTKPAQKALQTAIEIDPNHSDAWHYAGKTYLKSQDPQKASEALDRAIEINAMHPEYWKTNGLALLDLKKPEEAEYAFKQGLKYAPEDPELWIGEGKALLAGGDSTGAWKDFGTAMAKDKMLPDPRLLRGRLSLRMGMPAEGKVDIQQGCFASPNSPACSFSKAEEMIGRGEFEKAVEEFTQKSNKNHYSAEDYFLLAYAAFKAGETGPAKSSLSKMHKADPASSDLSHAFKLILKGDTKSARKQIKSSEMERKWAFWGKWLLARL